jgi:hypothetical protein
LLRFSKLFKNKPVEFCIDLVVLFDANWEVRRKAKTLGREFQLN